MKKIFSIFLFLIIIKCVSYGQIYSLYGVNLLTTIDDSRLLFKTFVSDKSDYLQKSFIGVNHDSVTLHLSYMNTNPEDLDDENYVLIRITRIYDDSPLEDWFKKVYLFQSYLGIDPKISVLPDTQLRVANWRLVQTSTIFNVIYNESERKIVEMLSYDLTALR